MSSWPKSWPNDDKKLCQGSKLIFDPWMPTFSSSFKYGHQFSGIACVRFNHWKPTFRSCLGKHNQDPPKFKRPWRRIQISDLITLPIFLILKMLEIWHWIFSNNKLIKCNHDWQSVCHLENKKINIQTWWNKIMLFYNSLN